MLHEILCSKHLSNQSSQKTWGIQGYFAHGVSWMHWATFLFFSPDKGGFQLLGCSFASLFSELRIFILPLSGLSLTSIWKMHVYLCSGKASPGAHTRNASKAAETVWISALILTCKVEILILMAEWCKIKLDIPFKLSWVFFFLLACDQAFLAKWFYFNNLEMGKLFSSVLFSHVP